MITVFSNGFKKKIKQCMYLSIDIEVEECSRREYTC